MNLMKRLALGAAACVVAAGVANAANVYIAVSSGSWNNNAIWEKVSGPDPDNYPVAGDTAIISCEAVTVDEDAAAAILHVTNGGTLQVEPEKVLTIGAGYFNSALATHQIDGFLVLEDGLLEIDSGTIDINDGGTFIMQGDTPRVQVDVADGMGLLGAFSGMWVLTDAAIGGSGSIYASNGDALVAINIGTTDDVTLTLESGAILRGEMTILAAPDTGGRGRLDNHGQVKADAGTGTRILLDSSLYAITDNAGTCGAPNWYVGALSTLRFEKAATGLTSAFRNDGAVIVDAVNVFTMGKRSGYGTIYEINGGDYQDDGPCP